MTPANHIATALLDGDETLKGFLGRHQYYNSPDAALARVGFKPSTNILRYKQFKLDGGSIFIFLMKVDDRTWNVQAAYQGDEIISNVTITLKGGLTYSLFVRHLITVCKALEANIGTNPTLAKRWAHDYLDVLDGLLRRLRRQ